jgi:polyphenol oxidase
MMLIDFQPDLILAVSQAADGNMSLVKGDIEEALNNRKKFFADSGIAETRLVYAKLEHGLKINSVGLMAARKILVGDGLITSQRGVFLFMLVADCLALAIFDSKNHSIGLLHASRHNLRTGIIKTLIESMKSQFGSLPEDLIVQFSPSIGPCCYKPFVLKEADRELEKYLVNRNGANALDIWLWTETELRSNGILESHIRNPRICTYCSHKYFSYKRFVDQELTNDYRFAVVFGMK